MSYETMSYDQWIAIGIANNHINKKFVSQFAHVLETKLKEHYHDKIKMMDPVAAFSADVESILPDLRPELTTIEAVDHILAPLPPLPPLTFRARCLVEEHGQPWLVLLLPRQTW
jgi:hypothetical protein